VVCPPQLSLAQTYETQSCKRHARSRRWRWSPAVSFPRSVTKLGSSCSPLRAETERTPRSDMTIRRMRSHGRALPPLSMAAFSAAICRQPRGNPLQNSAATAARKNQFISADVAALAGVGTPEQLDPQAASLSRRCLVFSRTTFSVRTASCCDVSACNRLAKP
jgi:hypothetical protein